MVQQNSVSFRGISNTLSLKDIVFNPELLWQNIRASMFERVLNNLENGKQFFMQITNFISFWSTRTLLDLFLKSHNNVFCKHYSYQKIVYLFFPNLGTGLRASYIDLLLLGSINFIVTISRNRSYPQKCSYLWKYDIYYKQKNFSCLICTRYIFRPAIFQLRHRHSGIIKHNQYQSFYV